MYGLVKIAAVQNINLNNMYSDRAVRLKNEYDDNLNERRDLASQRNPDVEREYNKKIFKGLYGGAGIGAVAGAGLGAIGMRKKNPLEGAAVGAFLGGSIGGIPGTIYGSFKGKEYRQGHEDPELLKNIALNEAAYDRIRGQIERHY